MNKEAPDFLQEEAEKNTGEACDLDRLQEMVTDLFNAENEVTDLKEKLKTANAKKTRLSQETIPEYVNKFGLSEIKMKNGVKVIIKDGVSVSIKEENKKKFYQWLKQRDEDSIIKLSLDFGKMESDKKRDLLDTLIDKQFDFDTKEGVHSKTQETYFKGLLGIGLKPEKIKEGLSNGQIVTPDKIEDFAKVFPYKVTKLKK